MSTFGFDYDKTFTAAPEAFRAFVRDLQAQGHTCVLVTARFDLPGWTEVVQRDVGGLMPIVFAGKGWKDAEAQEQGYKIDIWLDDHPEGVRPCPALIQQRLDQAVSYAADQAQNLAKMAMSLISGVDS